MGCRADGLSRSWNVAQRGCLADGMSRSLNAAQFKCRATGISRSWNVAQMGCHAIEMSRNCKVAQMDVAQMGCRTRRKSRKWHFSPSKTDVKLQEKSLRTNGHHPHSEKSPICIIEVTYLIVPQPLLIQKINHLLTWSDRGVSTSSFDGRDLCSDHRNVHSFHISFSVYSSWWNSTLTTRL